MGRASRVATKRQVLGQALVCVGCCCGRPDRGKPAVPVDWLKAEWKRLTWLGGLTLEEEYRALLEWATRSAEAGYLFPLPAALEERIFHTPFLPGEHAVRASPPACASSSPGSEPVAWQG